MRKMLLVCAAGLSLASAAYEIVDIDWKFDGDTSRVATGSDVTENSSMIDTYLNDSAFSDAVLLDTSSKAGLCIIFR